jgi:hypothetical protein
VLNRIRRAVSLTRARHFPRGRHRRALAPARLPAAPSSPATADASTVVLGRASIGPDCPDPLKGEDIALVRPYVLAWEKRVRARSMVVVSHLSADAWSALAGVR